MSEMDKTVIGAPSVDDKTQMVDPMKTQMGVPQQSNATQYAANVDCPVCKTPNPPSEKYCMDCGFLLSSAPAAESQEVVSYSKLVTSDGTQEYALKPGENLVGRENADVLLTHNTVSRKHAKIMLQDGKAFVEDLGSTNGTFVNGARINQGDKPELADGCEVVFGSTSLKFVAAEKAAEATETGEAEAGKDTESDDQFELPGMEEVESSEPAEDAADETPSALGKFVSKDGTLSFDIVPGANTLGRRAGANSIIISDPYCSGRHADINAENGSFILTDVGSSNGTLVNGVKLEPNVPHQILPDDEITIGRTVFKIEVA